MNRVVVLALVTAGCATPRTLICSGSIENATGREIRDVRIVHQPTGQAAMSSQILPNSEFHVGFEQRELKATTAELQWTDPRLGRRTAFLDLPRESATPAAPQRLVYTINAEGWVTVRLVPCD